MCALVASALVATLTACAPSAIPSVAPSAGSTTVPSRTPPASTPEPIVTPNPEPVGWVQLPWVDTKVDLAQGVEGGAEYMTSVAGGPEGGITFAAFGEGERPEQLRNDGERWSLQPVSGLNGWPATLLALPDRYLAITDAQAPDAEAAAWYSAKGATWYRTGDAIPGIRSVGVVAANGDRIVACSNSDGDAVTCRLSPDKGETWHDSLTVTRGWSLDAMAPLDTGFIGIVSDDIGRLRTMVSGDGAQWLTLDPDPTIVNAGIAAVDLVAHQGRLVLTGHARRDRGPAGAGAALFTSVDGRTWTQLALPAPQPDYWDLTELGDVVVATGVNVGPAGWWQQVSVLSSLDGLAWHAEHPSPAFRDATELRFGTVGSVAVAVVRTGIASGDSYEVHDRLYAATPIAAPDPGGEIVPIAAPAPDPVGAPAALRFEAGPSLEGAVVAATHGYGRFVAVGQVPSAQEGYVAGAWTSVDGRTWSPGAPIDAERSAYVRAVMAWSGGFVAAGDVGYGESLVRAVFWTSADGATWTRAPDRPAYELGSESMDGPDLGVVSIAATASRLLAVARSGTGGVVFSSTDGRRWDRIATIGESPNALIGIGADVLVVGRLPWDVRARGYVGAAWHSAGGATWSEPQRLESGELVAVATDGTRYVGVGAGPAAMVTLDGQRWTWAPDQSTLGSGEMTDIAGGSWGFVAVGVDQCAGALGGPSCGSVWRSLDGLQWSRTTLDGTAGRDHGGFTIAEGARVVVVFIVDRTGDATEVRIARV